MATPEAPRHAPGGARASARPRWALALPVLAVVVALAAAVVAGSGDGADQTDASAPTATVPVDAVQVTSDSPRYATLDELVAASDLVVRGEVTATERGRWFGDGSTGPRIQSRLVTLAVDEVLVGSLPGGAGTDATGADRAATGSLLLEEEGWLEDGSPIVVDGAAPSAVGDAGVWFLVDPGDDTTDAWIVVSAQGRRLGDVDDLVARLRAA